MERSIFGTIELVFKALCPFLDEDAVSTLFDLVEPAEEEDDGEGAPIEFESSDEEDDEEEVSDVEENAVAPDDLAIEKAALRQVR